MASPAFADVSLRYASGRDGISASASSPSAGFLGLQVDKRVPAQMSARVYSRYPSAPEVDVNVLAVRSVVRDGDKMRLQVAYNMEVPRSMLFELKTRIPSVLSAVTLFAEKYQITRLVEELKMAAVTRVGEVYDTVTSYQPKTSQLSVFFRNTFVQYQKTVQTFIDAVVKVLRETKFKMPGSDELTTIPEVVREVTSSAGVVLEKILQNIYTSMQFYHDAYVGMLMDVKLSMPVGDLLASNQFLAEVKEATRMFFLEFVKNMESLDTMLVKVGETLKAVAEKTQEFVDSTESEYLDAALVNINLQYRSFIIALKTAVE
uniref:Uncharacterized protein n=1 Tax=Tetraodon nigroviridis TaxID=99883 RepID=H3C1N3_TETNG